jgi:hypothetical protein
MSPEDTVAFLSKHVGRLLDPDVFAAMRTVVSRKRTLVFIDPHL